MLEAFIQPHVLQFALQVFCSLTLLGIVICLLADFYDL